LKKKSNKIKLSVNPADDLVSKKKTNPIIKYFFVVLPPQLTSVATLARLLC
jgi:hypothetical protein